VSLLPFLGGFTLFFWATATWWIPMLAILSYWQHVVRKIDRAYSVLYWDIVFPIGMYTVCTFEPEDVMKLPFLAWLPHILIHVALLGWALTFLGMMRSGARWWRGPIPVEIGPTR